MILCCGEALIDFLPVKTETGANAFQPFNGGSIYNVAIALGRLDRPVGFFGGISQDFFGQMLLDGLKESQVNLSFIAKSSHATTLAFVQFTGGQPQYVFLDEASAGRMLEIDAIPAIPDEVNALHFGSMSLINDPAGATLESLASAQKSQKVISLDPNIRASLVADRDSYLQRLGRMIALADIIKISDEDLEWMYPGIAPTTIAKQWLADGAKLVIITRGAEGATGYTHAHEVVQPVEKVTVADTVGAGDTFTAGLLTSLDAQRLLNKEQLTELSQGQLFTAMAFAAKVASITVSRAGANPPWNREV